MKIHLVPYYPLWFSAGADFEALKDDRCATERGTYAIIGAAVILTAVLAFISGSYALNTVFKDPQLSMMVGALYALIIFNFDRLVVSSIRRNRGFFSALLSAAPRILVALVIGVIVSKPLELRLFEGEIKADLADQERVATTKARTDSTKGYSEIAHLKDENDAGVKRVRKAEEWVGEATKGLSGEVHATSGSGIPGFGKFAEAQQKEVNRRASAAEKTRSDVAKQTEINNKQILKEQAELESQLARSSEARQQADGFLSRYSALEAMKRKSATIYNIDLALMALFVFIEIGPILSKLFARPGPYEALLSARETVAKMETEFFIKEIEEDILVDEAAHRECATERGVLMKEQLAAALATLRQSSFLNDAHTRVAKQMALSIEEWLTREVRKITPEASSPSARRRLVDQLNREAYTHAEKRVRAKTVMADRFAQFMSEVTKLKEKLHRTHAAPQDAQKAESTIQVEEPENSTELSLHN